LRTEYTQGAEGITTCGTHVTAGRRSRRRGTSFAGLRPWSRR